MKNAATGFCSEAELQVLVQGEGYMYPVLYPVLCPVSEADSGGGGSVFFVQRITVNYCVA